MLVYLRDGSAQLYMLPHWDRSLQIKEVADQTFFLTQSQYTDTGPTSPSTDPVTSDVWQGSAGVLILSHFYDLTWKNRGADGIWTPDLLLSRQMPYPLGQWDGPLLRETVSVSSDRFHQ